QSLPARERSRQWWRGRYRPSGPRGSVMPPAAAISVAISFQGSARQKTTSGAHQLSMGVQAHENTEARQQGHHGSPTVADEGQRYADHRQQSTDHAGVDEYIDKEGQPEAQREQARERVV